jgi:hypothetical protein
MCRFIVDNDDKQTQDTKDKEPREKCEQKKHGYLLQGIRKESCRYQRAKRQYQGKEKHPARQDAQALFA